MREAEKLAAMIKETLRELGASRARVFTGPTTAMSVRVLPLAGLHVRLTGPEHGRLGSQACEAAPASMSQLEAFHGAELRAGLRELQQRSLRDLPRRLEKRRQARMVSAWESSPEKPAPPSARR